MPIGRKQGFEEALKRLVATRAKEAAAGDEEQKKFEFFVRYIEEPLGPATVDLAKECKAICIFVNDVADGTVLRGLHRLGVSLVRATADPIAACGLQAALRCRPCINANK